MPHFRHQIQSGKAIQSGTFISFLTDFVLAPPPLSSAGDDDDVDEDVEEEEEDAFNDVGLLFLASLTSTPRTRLLMPPMPPMLPMLPLPNESWLTELMLRLTFCTTSRANDDLNMDEGEIVVACSSRMNSRISTSGFCNRNAFQNSRTKTSKSKTQ